ncbi:thymidylate synthase [Vibrio phage PWH3a-P1]|uniref:thymidylate synthase n=1 Tax=Vibrio phage PWH3a-P1 TaxID=754058 RepID=UPI0002C14A74|nr:thymidylate synthase [Vibrio phage PWH3a-P1]AGH31963.1 thymidylate synthase [Vibrio phage PWH3a-P1]
MSYEHQYLDLIRKVLREGEWVYNQRTGVRCLTIPRYTMEYKLDSESAPLLTTRPSYPVSAIAEIIGYLRQYTWANQFHSIGSPTWYKNANETQSWLDNKSRLGENHLGNVYGAALRKQDIKNVLTNICESNDDRGLKIDWWQPHTFETAALRPCLSDHQWTIVGDKVYLTSNQRSTDLLCGKNFNALQVYFLGMLGAKLSNLGGGTALHVMNNVHIYEPHLEGVEELLSRKPEELDTHFEISDWVNKPESIMDEVCHAREYFTLEGYKGVAQPKIDFELIA